MPDQDKDDFALKPQQPPESLARQAKQPGKRKTAARKGKPGAETDAAILSYRHDQKRKNNPDVGVVTPETDPEQPKTTWAYDPHLSPELQFDSSRAQIEKIIDDALASGDEATMRAVLETLKRQQTPYLNWTGKAERTHFDVDTVSLHVHERIDPMSILSALRKDMKLPSPASGGGAGGEGRGPAARASGRAAEGEWRQAGLFTAPFENLPLRDAVDFYKHEKGWSNRLVSGDSLLVMNSLLQKESMAGQVQTIYLDPPYGIKYGSNFQPFTNKRDVKDRKDEDLTQEPEMIKAFRDTWELGIHSYLTYLRDRLLLAKELLHESGSVFVQISDENLHHVREICDEIFGVENFVSVITVRKTGAVSSPDARLNSLATIGDFVVWYAKSKSVFKYRQLFLQKSDSESAQEQYRLKDEGGTFQSVSIESNGYADSFHFPIRLFGKEYRPSPTRHWSTTEEGIYRTGRAGRVLFTESKLRFKKYLNDFPVAPIANIWTDLMGASGLIYVVQTNERVIERCLLMTTDPGDLVLDPTCGSGTSAFVAEKWGRRWITCDTSRVSVTLAKQRLMTASYDYYELRYPHEGLKGGFIYKTVPHVTLKSIANNPDIDEIYGRMHPAVEKALAELNGALSPTPDETTKHSTKPANGQVAAYLPLAGEGLKEWEVPFDLPADWPQVARKAFDAFHAARQAMQKQMDLSIAAHADQEILYDQPQASKTKLRITGPFSVEAVPFPSVKGLGDAETLTEADASIARSGESARQHTWRDELLKTGIRGKGGQMLKFAELETLPGTKYLHCIGTLVEPDALSPGPSPASGRGESVRVVVSFGPEHAALEQRQVEMAMREAGELFPRPKMIVFCAFTFDPEAAKDIDQTKGITALKAQMNTDLLTDDLKKARASNQSFWLMGQPDVEVRKVAPPKGSEGDWAKDDWYVVEVHGFDYFDTAKGELVSGGKGKIAMWLLDTDYDERSLFPRQVFFPMAGKGEGWQKLKKNIKAELAEDLLEQFHGTASLPFAAGENRKIAVKIIDDRGIESLKVIGLE